MTSINKKKIPSRQALKYNFLYSQHVFSSENRKGQRGTLIGHVGNGAERQGKLVRAIVGQVFDVAVDIRKSSPTFGQWAGGYSPRRTRSSSGCPMDLRTVLSFSPRLLNFST